MSDPFERTELLIGRQALDRLAASHVLVAGLGGVGGAAAEALARAGVGRLTLLDHDHVAHSNVNRQVVALHSTVGRPKAVLMAERARDINPSAQVRALERFLTPEDAEGVVAEGGYDFVADCVDSIACKVALVAACHRLGVRVISSTGAGGRLDPARVRVTSLNQTHGCGLARELRADLRRRGVPVNYPVVFSDEPPRPGLPRQPVEGPVTARPRAINGTISYLPALFGLVLAARIIQTLAEA